MRRVAPFIAAALLSACASKVCTPAGTIAAAPPPPDWREIATSGDRDKLRDVRDALVAGVAAARREGFAARVDAGGRLYDPDYAEDGAVPPGGLYTCTTVTLGGVPAWRPAPTARCVLALDADEPTLRLVETEGSQRLSGHVFPETGSRGVFLGTILLSAEATALHYGRDPDRDRVGTLQRIGASRWRLLIPHPAWGGTVTVVEIVPAS